MDFYCHEKRLVVEIDGAAHLGEEIQDRDEIRQEIIEIYGVRFIRLPVNEVENDLESALGKILAAATLPLCATWNMGNTLIRGHGLQVAHTKCGGEVMEA